MLVPCSAHHNSATSNWHSGVAFHNLPVLYPLFSFRHLGGSIGWLSIIYAVDPLFRISHLELALRGGFSAVSASEWNFCASFLSPSGPSLLSPFPRSASSRWQLVGWRVACQYCSVDLEVGAVNLAVSPLQHGLACGERISCGVGGSVMACGF